MVNYAISCIDVAGTSKSSLKALAYSLIKQCKQKNSVQRNENGINAIQECDTAENQ